MTVWAGQQCPRRSRPGHPGAGSEEAEVRLSIWGRKKTSFLPLGSCFLPQTQDFRNCRAAQRGPRTSGRVGEDISWEGHLVLLRAPHPGQLAQRQVASAIASPGAIFLSRLCFAFPWCEIRARAQGARARPLRNVWRLQEIPFLPTRKKLPWPLPPRVCVAGTRNVLLGNACVSVLILTMFSLA